MVNCKAMQLLQVTVALALLAGPALADVCVGNGTDRRLAAAAEIDGGPRSQADLAPGARLCAAGDGPGTVAVFDSAEDLEGCSRRAEPGASLMVSAFPSVDLCRWEVDGGQ